MAYLNKTTQVLKAILTNKGREKLAQGAFNVSHFALADDEIDYTTYNPTHPSGSAYYGEAIENMPLLEAFPLETVTMKYKLTTLPRGTAKMPIISISMPIDIMAAQSDTETWMETVPLIEEAHSDENPI